MTEIKITIIVSLPTSLSFGQTTNESSLLTSARYLIGFTREVYQTC